MIHKETLIYQRVAMKAKDGANGFIYLHTWGTGYQQLIFPSHEAANERKALLDNTEKLAEVLKRPA